MEKENLESYFLMSVYPILSQREPVPLKLEQASVGKLWWTFIFFVWTVWPVDLCRHADRWTDGNSLSDSAFLRLESHLQEFNFLRMHDDAEGIIIA